jgi:hypothetical protein
VEVSYAGNHGTKTGSIKIHPGEPVTSLAGITASGNYVLTSDIPSVTAPLLSGGDFMGTLDGNGHTINLAINYTSSATATLGAVGMFYRNNGEVKNLILTGSVTFTRPATAPDSGVTVGAVAGVNFSTIRNVTSTVTVLGVQDWRNTITAGGIAGSNSGGTITNCYHNGNVTAEGTMGTTTLGLNWCVGGIAGTSTGTVTYCVSQGTVKENSSNTTNYGD